MIYVFAAVIFDNWALRPNCRSPCEVSKVGVSTTLHNTNDIKDILRTTTGACILSITQQVKAV